MASRASSTESADSTFGNTMHAIFDPAPPTTTSTSSRNQGEPTALTRTAIVGVRHTSREIASTAGGRENRERHEHDADLGRLRAEHEVRRQAGEDLLQLVGALGGVICPTGEGRDFLERVLVDAASETATATAVPAAAAKPAAT